MVNISVPFMIDFKYNEMIQEFDINYNHLKDEFDILVDFITAFPEKRINVHITLEHEDINIDSLKQLEQINSEIYFKLDESYIDRIQEFQDANLKYYFDIPASNWDIFNSLIEAGVSDIYISGELGFNLGKIEEILTDKEIKSRAIVNLAQDIDPFNKNDKFKSFFIRPEDLALYEFYIDSFEIYAEGSKRKYQTLFDIYAIDKEWYGDLQYIIAHLDIQIDNKTILPKFAAYRLSCGKKCFQGFGCRRCDRIKELAKSFEAKEMRFMESDTE